MIHLETLVIEQQNRVYGEWNGGRKYGKDYNRLKAIMNHRTDKVLVREIAKEIEDDILSNKVQSWINYAN